jgi:membrane-bound lytic murein transglycosylase B
MKQYSEMTKHSKEEVTHLDNTGWLKKEEKIWICYPVNGEAKKLNILMEFWKQFRGLFKKASATKGVTGEVLTIMWSKIR